MSRQTKPLKCVLHYPLVDVVNRQSEDLMQTIQIIAFSQVFIVNKQ